MTIQMLSDHLWQSTLFAAVCSLLAIATRRNGASLRHWIWFAASAKFLLPLSAIAAFVGFLFPAGGRTTLTPDIASSITAFSQPFTQLDSAWMATSASVAEPRYASVFEFLLVAWLLGTAIAGCRWFVRWRRIVRVMRNAAPMTTGVEPRILRRVEQKEAVRTAVRLVSSTDALEPGVFGLLHPVLFWPQTLIGRLDERQIEAIMAHELCHVRRRDNVLASVHMIVETIFWFHPLVWFIGARLSHERERACDEHVIVQGGDARTYAQTILKTCELCLEAPLPTYSGVTGPNLRSRIETILAGVTTQRLTPAQQALVMCGCVAALAWPLFLGFANAQTPATPDPRIEVSTVKPAAPDKPGPRFGAPFSGGLSAEGTTLRLLVQLAYGVQHFQIIDAPQWMNEERFDIIAKVEGVTGVLPHGTMAPAVRALLADRFQLKVHRETREGPVYALVAENSGHKLQSVEGMRPFGVTGRYITGTMSMPFLANWLAWRVERPVLDKTGLSGTYDIQLAWTPDPDAPRLPAPTPPPPPPPPAPPSQSGSAEPTRLPHRTPPPLDPNGPSIFTAIREQLGLRLDAQRGPIEVIVIDKVERPTPN
jgi:bla regulator protein BlaR1